MLWAAVVLLAWPAPSAIRSQGGPPPAAGAATPAAAELALGQALLDSARFPEAEQQLAIAVRKEPENAVAWNSLGLALHAQKCWARAATAFERASALVPGNALLLVNFGACHFELGQHERAAEIFRAAVRADAGNSRAHLFLARVALAAGDGAQAEREFALAVASPEPDTVSSLHQGLYFLRERRLDEARAAFERALVLDPGLAAGHLNLGLVLERQGRAADARVHLQRFRELSELALGEERMRLRVTAHIRTAHAELEAGHVEAALSSALRARDEAPDQPIVHELLARVLARAGRTAESERERALARELAAKAQSR